jgi:hypothetical protein
LPAARQLVEQALASDRKTYGDDHPKVATHRHDLAMLLRGLGDLPAARQLVEQALASALKRSSSAATIASGTPGRSTPSPPARATSARSS